MRKRLFGISALLLGLALGACTFTVGGGNSSSPAESDGSDSSGSSDSTGPAGEPGETIITKEEADAFLAEVPSAEEAIETFGGSIVSATIDATIVEFSTGYEPADQIYEVDMSDPDDLYAYLLYDVDGVPTYDLRTKGEGGYDRYTVPVGTDDVSAEQITEEQMAFQCTSFIGQMKTFYHEPYQEAYFSFDDCDEVVYSKVGDDLLRRKGAFTGLTYSSDRSRTYDGTLEILINKYGYMLEFKVDAVGTDGTETIPIAYDYAMSYNPAIERKTIQDLVPGYTGEETGEAAISEEEGKAYLATLPSIDDANAYYDEHAVMAEIKIQALDSTTNGSIYYQSGQIDISDEENLYLYRSWGYSGEQSHSLTVGSGDEYTEYTVPAGGSEPSAVSPLTKEETLQACKSWLVSVRYYHYSKIEEAYFSFDDCDDVIYSLEGNHLRRTGTFTDLEHNSSSYNGTMELLIDSLGFMLEFKLDAEDAEGNPLWYDVRASINENNGEMVRRSLEDILAQ